MLRALIHVIPVGVALTEIIINWSGYYVGASANGLSYFQFVAKAHEMTIQASLAAIVFSYVRYELSLGQGLPFGALFSGLQVTRVSFLWSMEFWGSACSDHLPIRRRLSLLLVIFTCVVQAATAGPASAILLMSRLDYWPAGSTHIWINATAEEMWPDQLDRSLVPDSCSVTKKKSTRDSCPSEWQAIMKYLLSSQSVPLAYQTYLPWTSAPHSF